MRGWNCPLRFRTFVIPSFLCSIVLIHHVMCVPSIGTNIILKAETLQYLELYGNSIPVYTDGSKQTNLNTGAGIYFPHQHLAFTLLLHPSNFEFNAEMYAIAYTLTTILNFNLTESKSFAIFSDSLSAIKCLQIIHPETTPP